MKIMVVFGTRPEAIKMVPVVMALKSHPEFNVQVCVTAQHREMLDQVLELFEIKPDFDLDLMRPGQSLGGLTSRALVGLEEVFEAQKPDLVTAIHQRPLQHHLPLFISKSKLPT